MPAPDSPPGTEVEKFGLRMDGVYMVSLEVQEMAGAEWELGCSDSYTGNRQIYIPNSESHVRGVQPGDVVTVPLRLDSDTIDGELEVHLTYIKDDGEQGDTMYAYPSALIPPVTVPLDTPADVEAFLNGAS